MPSLNSNNYEKNYIYLDKCAIIYINYLKNVNYSINLKKEKKY